MHLVMEVACTQTNGSDLMLSAHSSHLRSSASLMQHQRTTLLSKELPAMQEDHGTSAPGDVQVCAFVPGGRNNVEGELSLPFP